MAISVNPGPDNIWIDGTPVSKAQVRAIIDDIIEDANDSLSAIEQNGGKVFLNRESAVLAGQSALTGNYTCVATIEGTNIVYRRAGEDLIDPLFVTSPYWGVVLRMDAAAAGNIGTNGIVTLDNVGGTGNALTGDIPAILSAIGVTNNSLQGFRFKAVATNTGDVTISVSGSAARFLRDADGVPLPAGFIVPGRVYTIAKDPDTNSYRINSEPPSSVAASYRERSTHTGVQDIDTVSGLLDRLSQLSVANITAMDGANISDILPLARDASAFFLDADDVPLGAVSSLISGGSIGAVLAATGTGTDVQKTESGITFSAGKYLRWTALPAMTPPGPFRRAVVVLDVTTTSDMTGTSIALALDVTDVTRFFKVQFGTFTEAGGLVTLYGPGNIITRSLIYKPHGVRHVLAFSIDYETGGMIAVDPDGYADEGQAVDPALLNVPEIRIGQGCNMILHRAALFLEDA